MRSTPCTGACSGIKSGLCPDTSCIIQVGMCFELCSAWARCTFEPRKVVCVHELHETLLGTAVRSPRPPAPQAAPSAQGCSDRGGSVSGVDAHEEAKDKPCII